MVRVSPYLAVALIVLVQTQGAIGAWFYSDDWQLLRPYAGLAELFAIGSGHFAPVTRLAFASLLSVSGLEHFAFFLGAAALSNLVLGFGIVWWLATRVSPLLQALIAAACLVVPSADHTIFWFLAAFNLVPLAALLFWLGGTERRSRWPMAAFLGGLVLAAGAGGYGLVALFGFAGGALARRRVHEIAIAGATVLVLAAIYAFPMLSASGASPSSGLGPLAWLGASADDLLMRLHLPAELMLIALGVTIGLALAHRSQWRGQVTKYVVQPSAVALLVSAVFFVLLIYAARGGIEPLTASRYILLATALPTLLVVSLLTVPGEQRSRSMLDRRVYMLIVVLLLVGLIVRVPAWRQSSMNASYVGTINRDLIDALICTNASDADILVRMSRQDGFQYLQLGMSTPLWSRYRARVAETCSPADQSPVPQPLSSRGSRALSHRPGIWRTKSHRGNEV